MGLGILRLVQNNKTHNKKTYHKKANNKKTDYKKANNKKGSVNEKTAVGSKYNKKIDCRSNIKQNNTGNSSNRNCRTAG